MTWSPLKRGRLLRWYPPTWRARYGDELAALLEDVDGDEGPSWATRMSIRRAGVVERWYACGLARTTRDSTQRLRDGSIAVLWSWALMMVAGASVAKASEHFTLALPVADRSLAQVSLDVVTVGGVAGISMVALGGAACVPAFVRFLRAGGWRHVARATMWAGAMTVVSVASLFGLATWAHELNAPQRNGADAAYSAAFITVALIGAVTLGLWTLVAVKLARRVDLERRVRRCEGVCALGVVSAMALVTLGSITWFTQMGLHASSFVEGSSIGHWSSVTPQSVATLIAMTTALAIGTLGATRVVQGWHLVESAH